VTGAPVSGDTRIRDLEAAVARLSARVDSLEHAHRLSPPAHIPIPDFVDAPAATPFADPRAGSPGWLGLLGRTCIVLGGAFLLRALTNSGQVPADSGVWLGLAYAVLWLILAGRANGASAFFHGLSALIVALPLALEAVLGFKVMSGAVGSLVLMAFAVTSLGVAWHRRHYALAMTTTLGALAAAMGLAIGLSQMPAETVLPPVSALIVIGTVALAVAYSRNWTWLPWPAALGADLGVLIVTLRATVEPPRDAPLAAQFVLAVLVACYLGSFVIRIVLRRRDVQVFEIVQTAAALAIGIGGAVAIANANHIGVVMIALPTFVAGSVLYLLTFAVVAPRRGFGSEFYYVGTTALALAIIGVSLLFPYPTRPIAIAIGALAGSLAASRFGHPLLALQGAIAAIVASAQSGLITFTALVWLTHPQPWPTVGVPIGIVLAAVLAALMLPRAVHEDEPAILTYAARLALSLALVAGAGTLLVIGVGDLMGSWTADAGVMATMKTVTLAAAAVGLAWAGRSPRFVEFGWIAYGALGVGGLKILFEDLPSSRPSTLFIALAAYGGALIVMQKLRRSSTVQT
jgi:hypothetical protein